MAKKKRLNMIGQIKFEFGESRPTRRSRKIHFRDFDHRRHAMADLDLRTIPRKPHTAVVMGYLNAVLTTKRGQTCVV